MSSTDLKIRFDSQFCRMNCQIFSWPLGSGAWRELQERDVVWNLEGLGAMPPGLIEEENSVSARSDFGRDLIEVKPVSYTHLTLPTTERV